MIRVLSVEEMISAESSIKNLGVTESTLVSRAGNAIAEEISTRFKGGRILFVCGKGNNGADGKVASSILSQKHGFKVGVTEVNGNLSAFQKEWDIIVDCIFGTGLNREVTGNALKAINAINNAKAYKIAVDLPSGLSGNGGVIMGVAVKADLTIAIQEYKYGHFFGDGVEYSGELTVKDIGISVWGDDYSTLIGKDDALVCFPKRRKNTSKGSYGRTCTLGGSKRFCGAPLLASSASLKTGVGYVTLAVPDCIYNAVASKNPECITYSLKDSDGVVVFDEENVKGLLGYDSIAVGMGFTVSEEVYKIVKYLLENYTGNLIIDADGLNSLSLYGLEALKTAKCNVLLTPHPKEFSRMTGLDLKEVLLNPVFYAKKFAKEYSVSVLLKGTTSVVTDGERSFINTTGCTGMAKGGSGDVLSGVIAGISAKRNLLESACAGMYIAGLAGEIAEKKLNPYSTLPTDQISCLYLAINEILN